MRLSLDVKGIFARSDLLRYLPVAFLVLVAAAAALRAPLLTFHGYLNDTVLFRQWAAMLSLTGFERLDTLSDSPVSYFPNYALTFYFLKIAGAFYLRHFPSVDLLYSSGPFVALIKLIGLAGDLAIAAVLFFWSRKLAPGWRALLPPALYLFSPGVIYDTVVWGQLDSLHTALLLAAFFAWSRERLTLASILIAAAVMCKLQAAVFVPLLLLLLIRGDGVRKLLTRHLPAMAAVAFFVSLPFFLAIGPGGFLTGSVGSVGKYPFLTLNAMNVWWPFSRAFGGFKLDNTGPVPLVYVGFVVFMTFVVILLEKARRRTDQVWVLEIASLLSLAFFLFPTEIHERYLFPFFALAAIPAMRSRAWLISYLLLGVAFLVNLIAAAPVIEAPYLEWAVFGLRPLEDFWWLVFVLVFTYLFGRLWRQSSSKAPSRL